MTRLRWTGRILAAGLGLGILLALLVPRAFADSVAVIANKSVPVDAVDKMQLLDIYSGDLRNWSNGRPIVVHDLKINNETKELFYRHLGKTPSRMKSLWLKKLLSGEGAPPEAVETEHEMIERVAKTPGAIGFISVDSINDTVKTLAIIESDEKKKTAER
ncbi:MAG: substrate-binding domain-containing protein [candidate division Zixibacteria bacterium]|nr:substrate-binding domain-containing protein [candidate division Zixibacteria bacterium]